MREAGTMRGGDAMRAFIRLPTDAKASSGQREWKRVRAAVLALSSRPLMYVSREP